VGNTPSTCGKRIICLHEIYDAFEGFRPSKKSAATQG